MVSGPPYRNVGQILMHLNGGYTHIAVNDGRHWLDVETDKIPQKLRTIGSTVMVTWTPVVPTEQDSPDDIRAMIGVAIKVDNP